MVMRSAEASGGSVMTAAIQAMRAEHQSRQIGLAAVEHARRVPDHAAGHEADRVQRQRKHLAERGAGQRPERDRGGAEQIGGAPPFQRRDVLLPAEKQQHGSQHRRDHGGNEIKRGGIERHGSTITVVMQCAGAVQTTECAVTTVQSTTAALEIRLRAGASFQEKLRQLVGKSFSKKGAREAPFRSSG